MKMGTTETKNFILKESHMAYISLVSFLCLMAAHLKRMKGGRFPYNLMVVQMNTNDINTTLTNNFIS